ncbi:MAG: FAD-dependent oxidoreductase [Thermoleophilia bacterium]|nr:FAD-dependent oxidoreductase [Thermoleophilia bacterium]
MSRSATERLDVDVVVIGAGFAGLVAARELGRAGCTAAVLEARDRIGGRTWVGPGLGLELELGGGWVHWLQPHVWAELRRYGIGLAEPRSVDVAISNFGGRRTREDASVFQARAIEAMRPLEEAARAVFPRPYEPLSRIDAVAALDHLNIPDGLEALGVAPAEIPLLASYWGGNVSGLATDGAITSVLRWIAVAGWDAELIDEAAGTYTIEGGTRRLVEAIRADVEAPVLLDAPVTRLDHGPDGVVAHANGITVAARAAIVTVPWGALRQITFAPGLGAAQAAAARVGQASRGVKAWVRIKGAGEKFLVMAEEGHPLNFVAVDRVEADSRLLVCFGPDAAAFDASPSGVQATLRAYVPDATVDEVALHDWCADPYAGQTWLFMRPGQLLEAYPAFRRATGQLFFAGGDYADGWAGFMDGAVESGLRAARLAATAVL